MGSHWELLPSAPSTVMLAREWLFLVALSLNLAGAQKTLEEVPVQLGFDAHKGLGVYGQVQGLWTVENGAQVEGRWLTVQLATSHTDLVLPADPLRLSLHSIQTRDSGDIDFVLLEKGEGVCTGVNVTVHPTGLQGQYQSTFEGGLMHVRFVSTDYSNLILYVRFEDNEVTSLWTLLARRMPEDPMWVRQYLNFVEKFHLHKAPVFNTAGQCPPAPA